MAPTISSGSATRAMGVFPMAIFRISGLFQRASLKRVFVNPGAMALTRMPYWAHCWAITLVAMMTPALLME